MCYEDKKCGAQDYKSKEHSSFFFEEEIAVFGAIRSVSPQEINALRIKETCF